MTLCAAESRGEKCLNQFPSECVTDYEAAEADHVQIVVLGATVMDRDSAEVPGILAGRRGNRQTDVVAASFRTRGSTRLS